MLSYAVSVSTIAKPAKHPYILLVDDHRPTLRKMQEVIELDGHGCLTASSASEAIRLCDLRLPQVVITDLAMPNLDGRGLALWMRERFPSVPLILVTGEPLENAADGLLRHAFSAIYSKPVDIVSLLDRIARMMPLVPNRAVGPSRP